MPELPESLMSGMIVHYFLTSLMSKGLAHNLFVQNIWVESTKPEMARAKKGTPEASGLPYPLRDNAKIMRGQLNSQRPVYPPHFANKGTISTHGLQLKAVEYDSRNVVMNLGVIWLQVCSFVC